MLHPFQTLYLVWAVHIHADVPLSPSGRRGTLGPVDLMQCSVLWVLCISVPRLGRIGSQAGRAPINACLSVRQA